MTNPTKASTEGASSFARVQAGMARRRAAERRFKLLGRAAVGIGLLFLAVLLTSIVSRGYTAFWQTEMRLDVVLVADEIDPEGTRLVDTLHKADYSALIKQSLRDMFPEVSSRRDRFALYGLVSNGAAFDLRDRVMADPSLIGTTVSLWVPADDDVDMLMKGHIDREGPEADRRIKDTTLGWIDQLEADGRLALRFNTAFFTKGDSRDPELAGIRGALMGTIFTLVVTLALSFPLGVAAAVYLEEFAPKNRWTDLIEVNINNLAAVPSIVFGLLGLAVFINVFGLPRSAPLLGGLVLTLMTLPTIIIASRAALKSVPPSIRDAALGIGASPMQATLFHVIPLALPGMLTGTIIGMAQALGETAPLLMIGMVAFIADVPQGVFDPATALPVQIYLWADSPERAFVERTSAAIMVLLAFLALMNLVAVLLRKRFERRW
ncbi:phosphate ABC transporter permease PstA [Denitromonas iodatirespirans]|uniref:Phosphate transport system permease protein PstA n=1 Tax=Denitromonas iodatirespirans TaxID=2795389 RepID=A0A944HDF7_DENI1|nr:phosphate ABC transporter permease PstA [Denitromonas iodatirespirans]MBT0961991.1 phosphate ABC transporter permease PstA [Denitromonas iodatirespirans]